MISEFKGSNGFLSNFYECAVTYNGITFRNTEAAFQAQKTKVIDIQMQFSKLNSSSAKKKGRKVYLRSDWEEVKDQVMYEVVKAKFEQNPLLQIKLAATGDEELIEGNTWGDKYWGMCNGNGLNKLGQILMRVRAELRAL